MRRGDHVSHDMITPLWLIFNFRRQAIDQDIALPYVEVWILLAVQNKNFLRAHFLIMFYS